MVDNDKVARCLVQATQRRRSVTTTISSIRAPYWPGKYTPGSTLKAIPGSQYLSVAGDDVRVFVRLHADAVSRPVNESVAVTRFDEQIPCRCVDRLRSDSRTNGVDRCLLGGLQRLDTTRRTLRWPPDAVGTR